MAEFAAESNSTDFILAAPILVFETEAADVILIDDNVNFTSPMKIYAKDNLAVNLEPGRYYWKLDGILPSEIRTLQIESKVELKLRETSEGYELVNGGNINLNVKVYSNGSKIGEMLLKPSENNTVSGDKAVGGQNES